MCQHLVEICIVQTTTCLNDKQVRSKNRILLMWDIPVRHIPLMTFFYLSFFLYVMLLHSDSYLDLLAECSTLQTVPRPLCERAALSGFFQHRVLLNHRSHESRLTFREACSVCHSTCCWWERNDEWKWKSICVVCSISAGRSLT